MLYQLYRVHTIFVVGVKLYMTVTNKHVLVIPAHGFGTRIRELTGGMPKTLLEVGGQPILARLLMVASKVPDTRVVIYAQPEDKYITQFLNRYRFSCNVELRRMVPEGYLRALVNIRRDIGSEFSVFDSDLVAPLPELIRFLHEAHNWQQKVPLIIGGTRKPEMNDERVLWLSPINDDSATITPSGGHQELRFANAYHWQLTGLQEVEELVASSKSATFHTYMADLAQRRCLVGCVYLSTAHNINTSVQLTNAQADTLKWQSLGIERVFTLVPLKEDQE